MKGSSFFAVAVVLVVANSASAGLVSWAACPARFNVPKYTGCAKSDSCDFTPTSETPVESLPFDIGLALTWTKSACDGCPESQKTLKVKEKKGEVAVKQEYTVTGGGSIEASVAKVVTLALKGEFSITSGIETKEELVVGENMTLGPCQKAVHTKQATATYKTVTVKGTWTQTRTFGPTPGLLNCPAQNETWHTTTPVPATYSVKGYGTLNEYDKVPFTITGC